MTMELRRKLNMKVLCALVLVATRGCVGFTFLRSPHFEPTTRAYVSKTSLRETTAASMSESCDVAIFGGGFGGLYTALTLSRLAKQNGRTLDIALVEPSPTFVFLPLLYDLTVGTATELEVCPLYTDLLRGTGIRHIRATLQSLSAATDASGQAMLLSAGTGANAATLKFDAGVIAVGASPKNVLESIPGAAIYAQPFYTAPDAKRTRRLLNRFDDDRSVAEHSRDVPRIAVVGGGYGGVELAASVQRRLAWCNVTLLSRGSPMAGTRAEPIVRAALQQLGVTVEECTVKALEPAESSSNGVSKVFIQRTKWRTNETVADDIPWDAVLWTAGSSPSEPVASGHCVGLVQTPSGRLAVDATLRCVSMAEQEALSPKAPRLWALGDCAEIVRPCEPAPARSALPKTAQVAMQQADIVASNVLGQVDKSFGSPSKEFVYQDLGSMLTLGGPNAAVLAPSDGAFAPIFAPALDTANVVLNLADELLAAFNQGPVVEQLGLTASGSLGLSLSSHGLAGLQNGDAPGTLAGTLSGAARRTIYAVRMPTNQQRAVSLFSAAIATAAALAKEASDKRAST